VTHRIEIIVLQRFRRSEPLLVIVSQQAVEEADCVRMSQVLIFSRNELLPGRARVPAEDCVKFAIEPHSVLVKVAEMASYFEHKQTGIELQGLQTYAKSASVPSTRAIFTS
jgi:hypothetical protein